MELLINSSHNSITPKPFPKRSIPVQVRVGTPCSIVLELTTHIFTILLLLLKFNLIFRELLGKYLLLLTPIYSPNNQPVLNLILPYFRHFNQKLKSILDVSGSYCGQQKIH